MVFPARLTAFLLAFSLLLLIRDCLALTQQVRKGLDGNIAIDAAGRRSANIAKEAYNDHGVPAAEAEDGNISFKGRKMMSKSSNFEKKAVKAGNLDVGQAKISGAAHSAGNCKDTEKGNLNLIRCKPRRNRSSIHHPVKVKIGGFTAFSADYHDPKSHIPKNN